MPIFAFRRNNSCIILVPYLLPNVLLLPGGLAEEVTEKIIHAAFIPFGDLMDIQIPLDYETGMFLLLHFQWSPCQFETNTCFLYKRRIF